MRSRFLVAMVLLLGFAAAASAEVLEDQVGVGLNVLRAVRITRYWDYWYGPSRSVELTDVYLPIRFGEKTRIEPEIGFGLDHSASDTELALRLRMGVFRTDRLGDSFMSSFGVRAGLVHVRDTSFSGALCLGGDHFLSPHFSLGGEVQLDYCNNGGDYHTIVTSGAMIIRWYVPTGG